jgi:hypothetical protein
LNAVKYYRISKWVILGGFIAGIAFLAYFIWGSRAVHQVEHWPATEGVVTACQITSSTNRAEGSSGTHFVRQDELTFAFSYTIAAHQYVSRRFSACGQPPAYVVSQYPVGRRFQAHYNPNAPSEAVVEAGEVPYRVLWVSILLLSFFVSAVVYNLYQR